MSRTFNPKIDFGGIDFFLLPGVKRDGWTETFIPRPTLVEIPRGYDRHLYSRFTGWEISVEGQIVADDDTVQTADETKAALVTALQGRAATGRFSLYRHDELCFAECFLASGPAFTPIGHASIPVIDYSFTARSLRPLQVAAGGAIPLPETNMTAYPFEFPFLVAAPVTGISYTNRTGRDLAIKALAINGCVSPAQVPGGITRFRVTAGGDSIVLDLSGAATTGDAISLDGLVWEAGAAATVAIEAATAQHNGPFGHFLAEG